MTNKYKVGYILSTIMDYILTFGGSGAVIIYNYVSEDNSTGFKITLTGIILIIAMIYTCKTIFEHNFQNKENSLLQALGTATDPEVKEEINKKINAHKMTYTVYQELMVLLPFVVLYVVTFLGAQALEEMNGTVGMILASLGAGGVFHVIKKPLKDKADLIKFESKAKR